MTLREIDARDCCSRQQCRDDFPKATPGAVVRCDVCGRVWRFSLFVGWVVDTTPRCSKCGRAMTIPGVCSVCAPAVAPSTPRPDYNPDGVPAHLRDRRWRAR